MKKLKKHHGVIVPMVTPFTENGKIDEVATVRLTEHLISNKCHLFALGTTGEFASIPASDKVIFVKKVVETAANCVSIYAGISGNCLADSIELAKKFADFGVDAVVANVPGYYALTEEHILRYFEKLADRIPLPLIIYNIPTTTHHSIPIPVVEKLSYHPNIEGIKDSERNIQRLEESIKRFFRREDFSYLVGWAAQSVFCLVRGADGIIPNIANLIPYKLYAIYKAVLADNLELANRLQTEVNQISEIFQKDRIISQSLAVLKLMMSKKGICEPHVLPPFLRLSAAEEMVIEEKMRTFGI